MDLLFMETYRNRQSGISSYETGDGYIVIKFKGGNTYTYSRGSCGEEHVYNMQLLAWNNKGLNTYINIYKPEYDGQPPPDVPLLANNSRRLSQKTEEDDDWGNS